MKKGFSLLNIIIISGLFALGFLIFSKFNNTNEIISEKTSKSDSQNIENNIAQNTATDTSTNNPAKNSVDTKTGTQIKASALPDPSTLPTTSMESYITKVLPQETAEPTHNGNFVNEKYNYSIKFPSSWNLKNTYLDNVSVGTTPPKNGQGAVSIKIGTDSQNEIQQLRNEVKKYAGMLSLTERTTSIDGVGAQEITLVNEINKTKDVYTIFSQGGFDYLIKYTHESEEFVLEAKKVLANFKFIKK